MRTIAPDVEPRTAPTKVRGAAFYRHRTIAAFWSYALILLVSHYRPIDITLLAAATVQYLLLPHIVYWYQQRAKDAWLAELRYQVSEAAFYGVWWSVFHYDLLYGFCMIGAVQLGACAIGGARQAAKVSLAFAATSIGGGLIFGFTYEPLPSFWIPLIIVAGGISYFTAVGFTFRANNTALFRAKRAIEEQKRTFESLAQMSALTLRTHSVEDLLQQALARFKHMRPDVQAGIVLREPGRPDIIQYAVFSGIPEAESRPLIDQLKKMSTVGDEIVKSGNDSAYSFVNIRTHLKQLDGWLLLKSAVAGAGTDVVTRLFLDHIGSIVETSLLTLKLQRLANTDPLTGLYNRNYFDQELGRAIRNKLGPAGTDFTVISLDLNGLKKINDRYGHQAGDRYIVSVARLLKQSCRASDVVARLGGDEFVILCPDTTVERAQNVFERLTRADGHSVCDVMPGKERASLPIRFSVGSADSIECPPQQVVQTADRRMYAAKSAYYKNHRVRGLRR